jgi:ATP-dependent Clp protease ATP-binding subunit ClpX
MTKRKNHIPCVFCGDNASRQLAEKLEYFSTKNRDVFLCEKCFHSFSAGTVMGQFQLNNKILSLISSVDDNELVSELKNKITEYAPSSKYSNKNSLTQNVKVPPVDIYNYLCNYVIGQENAKKRISLTVYEHLRNAYKSDQNDKCNILFLGPSGSGKTLIVNSIAKKLDVPYVSTDATSFSPTGFQGADADSCIHDLYFKSDGDVDITQKGVVFVDEIDKLASNHLGTRLESFNYSTQSTLLKLIEGKKVKIPSSMSGDSPTPVYVDTSKILFCFGGAFNGLENIIGKKQGFSGKSIGFRNNDEDDYDIKLKIYEMYSELPQDILTESLIEFGLSTEFVGRIQTIVPLRPLNKEELMSCLTSLEDSPIRKNKLMFAESNVQLDFTEDFYDEVINKAVKSGTGVRALNSIVKSSISIAAFEYLGLQTVKSKRIIINKDCVDDPRKFEVF